VRASDIPDIREIYNHYVTNSVVTFDEKKWTLRSGARKLEFLQKLDMPFLVAEGPSGQILGYALVQPMSVKSAFRYSVENSIYLGQAATGKGLGRRCWSRSSPRRRRRASTRWSRSSAIRARSRRSRCTRSSASSRWGGWAASDSSSVAGWARSILQRQLKPVKKKRGFGRR
jgi:phosphinothricin acetyltransferase